MVSCKTFRGGFTLNVGTNKLAKTVKLNQLLKESFHYDKTVINCRIPKEKKNHTWDLFYVSVASQSCAFQMFYLVKRHSNTKDLHKLPCLKLYLDMILQSKELFIVVSWEKSEKSSPLSTLPFEFPNVNRIANRICILNLNLIQPAVQVLCLDGAL